MASANEYLYNRETPITFERFYQSQGQHFIRPNSALGKLYNFFSGEVDNQKQAYDLYLTEFNNRKTFAREDSQIQRTLEDYKKAGLNPLTAVMGNGISGNTTSGAKAYDAVSSKKTANDDLLSSALKVLALILLKK